MAALLLGASGVAAQDGSGEEWVVPREDGGDEKAATLLPEGSYIVRAPGVVREGPDGRLRYEFTSASEYGDLPAMELLPCSRLMEIERVVESRDGEVVFLLNAQAYVFEGRNYLLPLLFRVAPDQGVAEPEGGGAAEGAGRAQEPAGEPDPDALLERLEAGGDGSRGASPAPVETEVEESVALMREGTMVLSRGGRVLPGSEGRYVFAVDNDTDTSSELDAPIKLLECGMLEEMLRVQREATRPVRLRLSGHVLLYEGENYLLPTMYLVDFDREGNLVTAQ